MRRQLSNSIYGVLDYAAYPVGMLVTAPFIMRNLGVAQYGIWTVTTSIVSIGAIVASGFGDANIQRVAGHRGGDGGAAVLRVVRAAMGIHLVLGFAAAILIWCIAPALSARLALHDAALRGTCLACIRIAALLTLIRAIETVCISTQRAFERYGSAVGISIAGRLLSLVAAAVLALNAQSVAKIMAATAAVTALALAAQIIRLQGLLGVRNLGPSYDCVISNDLVQFGAYTWVIAASGVVFSQADRLIGGTSLGATAVVSYALCAQISQPVYGITAAGLHFLFPYVASRHGTVKRAGLAGTLLRAFLVNVLAVLCGAGLIYLYSDRVLALLATDEIARASESLLPWVLTGSALLALSVTGSYGMVALGRARAVAAVNVVAVSVIVAVVVCFMRTFGVMAIAGGRIAFAAVSLCVYLPLAREIERHATRIGPFASGEVMERA